MTDYWANFAKTGDPNGPGLPVWPLHDPATEPTLVLDEEISIVSGYHSEQCAYLDTLPVLFPGPFEMFGPSPAGIPPAFLFGRSRAFE